MKSILFATCCALLPHAPAAEHTVALTADDFSGLTARAVFNLFDDDNSGLIDSTELPASMIASMEEADGNHQNDNKMLTLEEFTTAYHLSQDFNSTNYNVIPPTTIYHMITKKQEYNILGEMISNLFVHKFHKKVEAENYMGTTIENTKCVKWGVARLFGEERKCVLVDSIDSVRYKVKEKMFTYFCLILFYPYEYYDDLSFDFILFNFFFFGFIIFR